MNTSTIELSLRSLHGKHLPLLSFLTVPVRLHARNINAVHPLEKSAGAASGKSGLCGVSQNLVAEVTWGCPEVNVY